MLSQGERFKYWQVLHGCLQSVLWKVRLNPLTDAIPVVNFNLTMCDMDNISFGAKTSRYGPHELGYRRATKTFTKWRKDLTLVLILVNIYL